MKSASRIAIIGAGFSGLTLAWELTKLGFNVEIFESQKRGGGLIQSLNEKVLVETAAHGMLASASVENLFRDLELEICPALPSAKAKWIFRSGFKRWPLTFFETLNVIWKMIRWKLKPQSPPVANENLQVWIEKNFGSALNDFLVSPALQGVYGVGSEELSTRIISGGLKERRLRTQLGSLQGSVAPRNGMQALIDRLAQKLATQGSVFHWDARPSLAELQKNFDAVVVATSIESASQIFPELGKIPRVSLSTITLGYSQKSRRPKGFGCLFPKSENMNSLGVLFNTDIFPNRGELQSETWIFGKDLPPEQIFEKALIDRDKLVKEELKLEYSKAVRWPKTLPLYGSELETLLESDFFVRGKRPVENKTLEVFLLGARVRKSEKPLYLTGNYLGGIGLTKILSYNERLAQRILTEVSS